MPASTPKEPNPNFPKSYRLFSQAITAGRSPADFGFHGTRAQVYRFANRYCVARSFREIALAGYEARTIRAYGALFRHLITCSAAEQYAKILGDKKPTLLVSLDKVMSHDVRLECIKAAITADPDGRFFEAVRDRIADPGLAIKVEASLEGRSDQISPLVRAVRHAFAHGDLAPGANSAKPGVAQKFTNVVCPAILDALDADFTVKVGSVP